VPSSFLAAGFGFAAGFFASDVLGAAFLAAGFFAGFFAGAPSPAAFNAASASDSSTLDCAAFASTPAAFSAASSSLLVRPLALAIS
jgi:hypothetical protein